MSYAVVYRHPPVDEVLTINPGLIPGETGVPRDWLVPSYYPNNTFEMGCKEFTVHFTSGMASCETRLAAILVKHGFAHAAPPGEGEPSAPWPGQPPLGLDVVPATVVASDGSHELGLLLAKRAGLQHELDLRLAETGVRKVDPEPAA